jgi:hypothetical protein
MLTGNKGNSMAKYTASRIRDISGLGTKILWELCPPLDGSAYVITSAVVVPFTGPETYVFPATPTGEIVSWEELKGSYRGGLSAEEAIIGAGYKPVE